VCGGSNHTLEGGEKRRRREEDEEEERSILSVIIQPYKEEKTFRKEKGVESDWTFSASFCEG